MMMMIKIFSVFWLKFTPCSHQVKPKLKVKSPPTPNTPGHTFVELKGKNHYNLQVTTLWCACWLTITIFERFWLESTPLTRPAFLFVSWILSSSSFLLLGPPWSVSKLKFTLYMKSKRSTKSNPSPSLFYA